MASDKELDEMPYNNYYLVMPSLMLVLFLAALDQTIVCECMLRVALLSGSDLRDAATALPTIAEKFHASSSQVSAVSAYIETPLKLAYSVFMGWYKLPTCQHDYDPIMGTTDRHCWTKTSPIPRHRRLRHRIRPLRC